MITRSAHQSVGRILLLVLVYTGLTACNPTPTVTDEDVNIIDDVALVELLDSEAGVVLVDTRVDYRYRLGHLPGAINIPLPELTFKDSRFPEGAHVVVYGDSPRSTLSHAAAKKLLAGGNLIVSDFRGGYEMWKQADRDTVTSQ
jgi:rhodanese-related sulfurtransferase